MTDTSASATQDHLEWSWWVKLGSGDAGWARWLPLDVEARERQRQTRAMNEDIRRRMRD